MDGKVSRVTIGPLFEDQEEAVEEMEAVVAVETNEPISQTETVIGYHRRPNSKQTLQVKALLVYEDISTIYIYGYT